MLVHQEMKIEIQTQVESSLFFSSTYNAYDQFSNLL